MTKPKLKKGDKLHHWTILSEIKAGLFLCECDCGRQKKVHVYSIKIGLSKSCGQCSTPLPGDRINNIVVLDIPYTYPLGKGTRLECLCLYCGGIFFPLTHRVVAGNLKSCGCIAKFYRKDEAHNDCPSPRC